MPDSSNSDNLSLSNQQRELLERHYPRTGYWFNMLPTHPFIHGPNASQLPTASQLHVPRGLSDVVSPLPGTLTPPPPYNMGESYAIIWTMDIGPHAA